MAENSANSESPVNGNEKTLGQEIRDYFSGFWSALTGR